MFQAEAVLLNHAIPFFFLSVPTKDCGGILTDISGWITSPDLDEDGRYDFNLNCTWIIEADDKNYIKFQLLYVDMWVSEDCSGDRLLVSIVFY